MFADALAFEMCPQEHSHTPSRRGVRIISKASRPASRRTRSTPVWPVGQHSHRAFLEMRTSEPAKRPSWTPCLDRATLLQVLIR